MLEGIENDTSSLPIIFVLIFCEANAVMDRIASIHMVIGAKA